MQEAFHVRVYVCIVEPAKVPWEEYCSIHLLQMHFILVKASVYNLSFHLQHLKVTLASSSYTGGILAACLQLCKPFNLRYLYLFFFSSQLHNFLHWKCNSACWLKHMFSVVWYLEDSLVCCFYRCRMPASFPLPPDMLPNILVYLDAH